MNSAREEPLVLRCEVVGVQEEGDPATSLIPHRGGLLIVGRDCEKESRAVTGGVRSDPNEPLVGTEDGVLDQDKAQVVDIVGDRHVVVVNNDSQSMQAHSGPSIRAGRLARIHNADLAPLLHLLHLDPSGGDQDERIHTAITGHRHCEIGLRGNRTWRPRGVKRWLHADAK